jgi:apolipoprotein N-acyltransferase
LSDEARRRRGGRWPAPGTLVSVVLTVAAFPPLDLQSLVWIALVPWFLSIARCRSAWEATIQGFWMNFLAGSMATFWLVVAIPDYLGVHPVVGVVLFALHGLVTQLQFVVFAPLLHWWLQTGGAKQGRGDAHGATLVVLGALLYTGLDWVRPSLLRDTLGLPLHGYTAISQIVDLGGPRMLTCLVLIVNLGLFVLIRTFGDGSTRRPTMWRRALPAFAVMAGVVGVAQIYGMVRYDEITERIADAAREVRFGVVQGNVPGEIKHRWASGDAQAARESLERYMEATDRLLAAAATRGSRDPIIVVWPETAYPGIYRRPENDDQLRLNIAFDRYVARRGVPFVFGAYDREDRVDRRVLRNALFFVEPRDGQAPGVLSPMEVYHKHLLFPVGEYMPFLDEAAVRPWLPGAAVFSRGEGPRVVGIELAGDERVLLGPSICYEDLFPSHMDALARLGADVLINVSNDAWFGDLGEPRLHLILARLASLSTRRAQVRATNTGYSALILPNGDLPEVSRYGRTQTFDWRVPIMEPVETVAVRWGDWLGGTSLAGSLVGWVGMRWTRRGRRRAG